MAPKYFTNGFESFYIIFKIFTMEGWYDIPEAIAKSGADWMGVATRIYFMLIVLTGGIFGFSIVNAIFVEEMISNESEELEERMERVERKLDFLIKKLEEKEE
jgi:voltage-gated sodium channel